MWYLHFSDHFTQLVDDPIEVKFPQTTVLLLEQEGLYESFCWEASNLKLFVCRFRFWRREVWENSIARERVVYGLAKWTKFLEKCLLVRYSSFFLGPAGGSRTRKGAFALQDNITWLVETEIAFSVQEQHFISTTAGEITAKVLGEFSGNCCTKSWISRGPVVRSWWKAV